MRIRHLAGAKRWVVWVSATGLVLSACAPVKPESRSQPGLHALQVTPEPAAAPSEDPVPSTPPRYGRTDWNGIALEGVAFDSRTHRLRVVDQPGGPASVYPDAAAVAARQDALAVVNGGFFTPEGAPLGLLISGGRRSGAWNSSSSLGSGIWMEEPGGRPFIARRSEPVRSSAASMRELMQAGPLLIERGRTIHGLENAKNSVRTVLLWDGGHQWWIGISSPCTLAELAAELSARPPVPWQPSWALNLDGGRSSELWVASSVAAVTVHRRPLWNRPVRNFLVLSAR